MFKHILVPTDGSRLSHKAMSAAMKLAKLADSRLTVLHVVARINPLLFTDGYVIEPELLKDYEAAEHEKGEKYLKKAAAAAVRMGVRCTTRLVTSDTPHKVIISTARSRDCDVIVMASHGRGNLSALLMGSETTQVLAHCKRPVLVVR
ncbi:MAG: universal stress protein [Burkholderiales bacterium]|nr:universal stress protein [Burkholderiales bacterium]